jgi:hypothetical protein
VIVLFNGGCLAGFFKFSSSTLELDLHNSVTFFKTRAPQLRSLSSFAPATRSTGHVGCWCPARGLHVPESLLLFGARDGHVLPFLPIHGVGWSLRWSTDGWVASVTTRVLHAPSSPVESAIVSTAGSLFLRFFLLCVVYSHCFSCTVCLCIAKILLKFLLAIY